MTASRTKIERSAPAIRAALAQVSPTECAQFETEFAEGLARASAEFDLAPAEAVLERWWGIAAIRLNALSEQEKAQVAAARGGEFGGLRARDEHGNWVQLQMARYGPVWLEIAAEQYAELAPSSREQVDARLEQLLENPRQPRAYYDERSDQWTTTYGEGAGLLVFAIVHEHQRLIVLRLV